MHWTGPPNARWHGILHGRHIGSCSTTLANKEQTPVLSRQLGTGGIRTLRFTPDPGRTRTYNPRLRGPMPYPLGHGATRASRLQRHSPHCRRPPDCTFRQRLGRKKFGDDWTRQSWEGDLIWDFFVLFWYFFRFMLLGGESDKKHSARPPGPNMKNTKNKSSDCPLKTLCRSHFGSRYKLGCCGHASPKIMMRVIDSRCFRCVCE